ncbi:DUF6777 domain-containing protein [Streptomyces sp. NPDC001595]|uniref:DUF6777 domain-containing protein n=1 Tax=Streptomyces sp. NPDC001532 TaxID=3154520 RepID=UPI00332D310F
MSAQPPNSGRPTGPPSGPLNPGRAQPPPGPPPAPPPTPADEPPEPGRPWWKSVPRVATVAVVVAALATVGVVLLGGGGGSGSEKEVFLQAASKQGPDPYTASTANKSTTEPVTPSPVTSSPAGTTTAGNRVQAVPGGEPGLYGGTQKVAACDVEKQIRYLTENAAKNKAFASVLGIQPSDVPARLRSYTPVQLLMDTRVTNHGYRDGEATEYQAILQSGTAVLVDDRGVPRVRCACGNPLTEPVQQQSGYKRTGDSWPSFNPSQVVVVQPAEQVVKVFVLHDTENDEWIARPRGDDGDKDKPTKPPATPTPSASVTTLTPSDGTTPPSSSSEPEDPSTTVTPTPDSSPPPPDTSTSSQPPAPDTSSSLEPPLVSESLPSSASSESVLEPGSSSPPV